MIVQMTVSIPKKVLVTSDLDNSIEAFFSLKRLFSCVIITLFSFYYDFILITSQLFSRIITTLFSYYYDFILVIL